MFPQEELNTKKCVNCQLFNIISGESGFCLYSSYRTIQHTACQRYSEEPVSDAPVEYTLWEDGYYGC